MTEQTRQDRNKIQGQLRAARDSIAGARDLATPRDDPNVDGNTHTVLINSVVDDDPGCVCDVLVVDEGVASGQLIKSVRCPAGLYVEGQVTLMHLLVGGQPVLQPAVGGAGGGDVINNGPYFLGSTYGGE